MCLIVVENVEFLMVYVGVMCKERWVRVEVVFEKVGLSEWMKYLLSELLGG